MQFTLFITRMSKFCLLVGTISFGRSHVGANLLQFRLSETSKLCDNDFGSKFSKKKSTLNMTLINILGRI